MGRVFPGARNLSTHDLTRRSTISESNMCNIRNLSTHDLTRRSTSPERTIACLDSTFQLTTSHGGRPAGMSYSLHLKITFNSRPHTEVDRTFYCSFRYGAPFNSRPHTEVDRISHMSLRDMHLSTHDLTRRSTYCHYSLTSNVFFQLTTSHGGRLARLHRRSSL